ncbi:putative polyketide synthase [Colletotrichum eremochloae]|nr:putative polyketide synthase [Colletotrichum eremochloae]
MSRTANGVNNGHPGGAYDLGTTGDQPLQDPIAVVGFACRLPDECDTPQAFWKFLEGGGVAKNDPPPSRYNIKTHYDGTRKEKTMASPGGMYLQNVDVRDLDAQFFKLSRLEAISMDPQQRQLLEVVYEGLENSGITLKQLDNRPIGCFVGSFACDYGDIQARDPMDRAPATVVGIGRAMLSNRISHFLNIKGPSMTIDTACSGSLTGLDVACRYLQAGEIEGAIIGGANIYMSPEHVMDWHMGSGGTASHSGKCHTFDAKADGYIKAEAINMVYIKRLSDALRDGDPIRAIIRGSAVNSDGWTAGIASPNSDAQAAAIRRAYENAGIKDLSLTGYVECHGTGTRAGDVIEVKGVSSVFREFRPKDMPLRIGSVKSNIGHSEPAAGISGLLKAILALEHGVIPGNPTFIDPNPNLNFDELRVLPSRTAIPWPSNTMKRASVNSFGYGGSNAHVIVDAAEGLSNHVSSYGLGRDGYDMFDDDDDEAFERPYLVVLSANDAPSLQAQLGRLDKHLSDTAVRVKMRDLAYTLADKRSRHFHRGYTILSSATDLGSAALTKGTTRESPPSIGVVFTGQGAQWPAMGKQLLETYPVAANLVRNLDDVLQELDSPPSWTLWGEELKSPELSQPAVTALQLAILGVLSDAGVSPTAVVGHSSGEIAAATAAGHLSPEQAIKIAYLRGQATTKVRPSAPLGMLAVGLSAESTQRYLAGTEAEIACINSPESVTVSGYSSELVAVEAAIKSDGKFARLLQVKAAYHSRHMLDVGRLYKELLINQVEWDDAFLPSVTMVSSTTGDEVSFKLGPDYWVQNMVSPVLFSQAAGQLIAPGDAAVDILIEIGPSGALAGPVGQIKKLHKSTSEYHTTWKRGDAPLEALLSLAGQLFIAGHPIDITKMNRDSESQAPSLIVDLPNYSWNHSVQYWAESEASADWRYRDFVHHDLLGTKILGTSWQTPTWKKIVNVQEEPWLADHMIDENVIFPASGYIAMAIEALFQRTKALGRLSVDCSVSEQTYRLRDVRFNHALSLDNNKDRNVKMLLSLTERRGTAWHEFKITSIGPDRESDQEHCRGLVSIVQFEPETADGEQLAPLQHGTPASTWYKAMREVGYSFGPSFQKQIAVEAVAGQRRNRALVSFEYPPSSHRQSLYPLHPACLDSCFQAGSASLHRGHRTGVSQLLLPAMIDELTIPAQASSPTRGMALASAEYSGKGRKTDAKRYKSHVDVFDIDNGRLVFRLKGLHYHALDHASETQLQHTFTRLKWNPDVTFLSADQLRRDLTAAAESPRSTGAAGAAYAAGRLIDLVAHKQGYVRVLERAHGESSCSLWLDDIKALASETSVIGCEYSLSLATQNAGLEARTRYGAVGGVKFVVHDDPDAPKDDGGAFDVAIIQVPALHTVQDVQALLQDDDGNFGGAGLVNGHGSTPYIAGFESVIPISTTVPSRTGTARLGLVFVGRKPSVLAPLSEGRAAHVVHLEGRSQGKGALISSLSGAGLTITQHAELPAEVSEGSTVLVLDEVFLPVISSIRDDQLAMIQELMRRRCRLLWVTSGGHMNVTNPEHSLFVGVLRSLLAEDPTCLVMTVDIESSTSSSSTQAILQTMRHLESVDSVEFVEREWVERGGVPYISRVVPNSVINKAEEDEQAAAKPVVKALFRNGPVTRLINTRIGSLDGLVFAEVEDPVGPRDVEVEIHAAALNFKDLAHIMGFLPSDEQRLGLECAGIVSALGAEASARTNLKRGDRVVVIRRDGGCFANRVRSRCEDVSKIPDSWGFEEAAGVGVCFMTAVYGLIDLANIRDGQTVLIHSAAGGVGLACLQICAQYDVEVYVTVGTEEKRKFIRDEFGVPDDHMFTSRSTAFAQQLMDATKGRGVDIVMNSLAGDLLHESWRCIADNGTFVEIGKKDILERNALSMEPFDRNASYRAFDLSTLCKDRAIAHRLTDYIFRRGQEGSIRPIHICKTFAWENIVDALRYMRDGKHIGKIIISSPGRSAVKVPVRPMATKTPLRPDVPYLIVGGFKGLCASLAIYMAREGARHLVVMARSGYTDQTSQATLMHLSALGCRVDLVQGDVTVMADVERAVTAAGKPLAGIIMGAMVLKDGMFDTMTGDNFRAPIDPKVKGAWNLHRATLAHNVSLDFFTLLSSISGVGGQRAQTNYSAGNVFLDAFAVWRHAQGLPACSVDLGIIEDVGYFTDRDAMAARLRMQGWTPINEALLHRILRLSLLQQSASPVDPDTTAQIITGIPNPLGPNSPQKPVHRFSALRPRTATDGASTGDSDLALLRSAAHGQGADIDKATLLAAAVSAVNGVLTMSLGLSEPLEPTRPLKTYGIDSLVAVELRNWIRTELSIELSALEIVGAVTLVALCEVVLKKLLR